MSPIRNDRVTGAPSHLLLTPQTDILPSTESTSNPSIKYRYETSKPFPSVVTVPSEAPYTRAPEITVDLSRPTQQKPSIETPTSIPSLGMPAEAIYDGDMLTNWPTYSNDDRKITKIPDFTLVLKLDVAHEELTSKIEELILVDAAKDIMTNSFERNVSSDNASSASSDIFLELYILLNKMFVMKQRRLSVDDENGNSVIIAIFGGAVRHSNVQLTKRALEEYTEDAFSGESLNYFIAALKTSGDEALSRVVNVDLVWGAYGGGSVGNKVEEEATIKSSLEQSGDVTNKTLYITALPIACLILLGLGLLLARFRWMHVSRKRAEMKSVSGLLDESLSDNSYAGRGTQIYDSRQIGDYSWEGEHDKPQKGQQKLGPLYFNDGHSIIAESENGNTFLPPRTQNHNYDEYDDSSAPLAMRGGTMFI